MHYQLIFDLSWNLILFQQPRMHVCIVVELKCMTPVSPVLLKKTVINPLYLSSYHVRLV